MGSTTSRPSLRSMCARLYTELIPYDRLDYWRVLISSPFTLEQVYSEITTAEVRQLKTLFPTNFVHLIVKVTETIISYSTQGVINEDDKNTIHTALGLLIRLMPFVHEMPEEKYADKIFWQNSSTWSPPQSHFQQPGAPLQLPLGARLLQALVDFFFVSNFTISWENKVISNLVWFNQLSQESTMNEASYLYNRQLVVRALLACLSDQMYCKTETVLMNSSPWVFYFTTNILEKADDVFESLMNVILRYDPVGWGIPYSSYVVKDQHEPLLHASLQLIDVLLDYNVPEIQFLPSYLHDFYIRSHDSDEHNIFNIYLRIMQEMHDQGSFSVLYSAICRLLSTPLDAASTYLPDSIKGVSCFQELLFFFWKLLEINQDFLSYILAREDVTKYLVPALYLLVEYRKDSTKYGLVAVVICTIFNLSGYRMFSVQLNEPFNAVQHPEIPVFYGCYADLLLLSMYKVFSDSPKTFQPMHVCLLSTMSNITPFIRNLSLTTVTKLFALMDVFSNDKFTLANETNHAYILYFLEALNNIIQYQSAGNNHVLQAILANCDLFHRLATIPLAMPSQASPSNHSEITSQQDESPSTAMSCIGYDSPQFPSSQSIQSRRSSTAVDLRITVPNTKSSLDPHEVPVQRKFVATPEWIESWKKRLPINLILHLIDVLGPQVDYAVHNRG
eukprot:TRINITY_DN4736_c0_g1_i1.p1 TRINITY_DN4736_c0_g1~~TRINITY_DN4736_c0_g1_i1.p1  ORF type:complete len:674 (-),score=116.77 TRINITY_DN4736_c0_g1_i1:623-2644(-)